MNLEPEKPTEIRAHSGTARVFASITILALAAIAALLVLEVIPLSAFREVAAKTFAVIGLCALSAVAIGFLSKR